MIDNETLVLQEKILKYAFERGVAGINERDLHRLLNIPYSVLRLHLNSLVKDNMLAPIRTLNLINYRLTGKGEQELTAGKYSQIKIENSVQHKKKYLFISYADADRPKVNNIRNELKNHPYFEALIIADRRKPNHFLPKLIKEGIDNCYCIIPIFTPDSFKEQWINQEVGYAECKNKQIIPIIEESILGSMKGFVNKQNQCPYRYNMKPYKPTENREFMAEFRKLIKDLEETYDNETGSNTIPDKKSSGQRWYF